MNLNPELEYLYLYNKLNVFQCMEDMDYSFLIYSISYKKPPNPYFRFRGFWNIFPFDYAQGKHRTDEDVCSTLFTLHWVSGEFSFCRMSAIRKLMRLLRILNRQKERHSGSRG